VIFRKYGSSDIETAANSNIFEEILTSSAEIMLSCRVLYVMEQDERLDFGTPFLLGLNITLFPANMPRLSFGPCKKKIQKSVLAKFSVF